MERSVYASLSRFRTGHWWFVGRALVVEALLRGKRAPRILDVGSGAGAMVPLLQTFGRVTALEPDAEMARELRDHFSGLDVIEGTLESPAVRGTFGMITLFDVLEHIENDTAALARIHTLLGRGGWLVLTVPAYQFLWSRQDVQSHHKRRYTARALREKVEAAGFSVERITYFNTFLFPFACAVRMIQRIFGAGQGSDLETGGAFNGMLRVIFGSERSLLRIINFPFGLSTFCLARKKVQ